MSKRPCIIAANWKMYKTLHESKDFMRAVLPKLSGVQAEVLIAAPFTSIAAVAAMAEESSVQIGAQNMNDASEGAFTGEVAAKMVKDAGATFVILGHSERRKLFGESSELVNLKLKRSFEEGLRPIVCIGETKEDRMSGKIEEVLGDQLSKSLSGLNPDQAKQVVLAYEPVWAIGTGDVATPKQAQETQKFCREWVQKTFGEEVASRMPILYGGSVKGSNAKELLEMEDIDGALVGGASLKPDSFLEIVQAVPVNVSA